MCNIRPGGNSLPGFVEIYDLGQLSDVLLRNERFRIVYKPVMRSVSQYDQFVAVSRMVEHFGRIVYDVDEVWRYTWASTMPEVLERITYTGRHVKVTLLYTAQTTARIAKGLIGPVMSRCCLFRLGKRDLANLLQEIDIPEDVQGRLLTLPDRWYYERDSRMRWTLRKP